MPTEKTPNYTPAMTATIVETYESAGTDMTDAGHDARAKVVKQLAADMKRSERSIRSKLVTLDKYIARTAKSTVTGDKPEKKEVMAARLSAAVGEREINGKVRTLSADSLEKMNKPEIDFLLFIFNSELADEVSEPEPETGES